MTKQSASDSSSLANRTLMSKSTNLTGTGVGAGAGVGSSTNSQFDDASSVSSYSGSFENESMSVRTVTNDSLMKAAMVLTARRSYPRRSAPTIATGRRNLKSEPVAREEAERRRVRRERNKVAATRCRQKRNEITTLLQRTVEQLEAEKRRDEEQLRALETMRNHLQFVLNAHESVCEQQRASGLGLGLGLGQTHLVNNAMAAAHGASLAHSHSHAHSDLMQPCGIAFGNAVQAAHARPQTLHFGHQTGGANTTMNGMVHGSSTAVTPATDLLAFADVNSMPSFVTLNNANRCFGQVVLGGAN